MVKYKYIFFLLVVLALIGCKRTNNNVSDSNNAGHESGNQSQRTQDFGKEIVIAVPNLKSPNTQRPKLPIELSEPVEFEINAYSTITLLGSSNRIVIGIDYIIDGKIRMSISWRYGNIIVAMQPMGQNDSVNFAVGDQIYTITLKELTDFRYKKDIARFRLSYAGKKLSENEKIEKLLLALKDVNDALFVENGDEYAAGQAADFLSGKWESTKKEIKTAQDFITLIGSKSSITGSDYIIRYSDGTEVVSEKWFQNHLQIIESDKLKVVDVTKGQRVRYSSAKEPGKPLKNIKRIATGNSSSTNLAIKADGSIVGWGWNDYDNAVPPDGNDFIDIATGWGYSLALRSNGTIIGWGYNDFGQATPPDGNDYVAISAGSSHNLALKSDGSIVCWGRSAFGLTTPPDGNNFVAISAGVLHSLALSADGFIISWGAHTGGYLRPPFDNDFVAVSAGEEYSLALKSDGSIVGWGVNLGGRATPPVGNDFVAIAAARKHALALKSDGSIVGWGYNGYGQATPPKGNDFIAIAAGWGHSVALKVDGTVVGWGQNDVGQATPKE